MFDILINFIVFLLSSIVNIVLSPFLLVFNALIPDFEQYFSSIITFLSYGLNYFNFFIRLFMIPYPLIVAVLSFSLSIVVFTFGVRTVYFFINAYKTFKP